MSYALWLKKQLEANPDESTQVIAGSAGVDANRYAGILRI